MVFILKTNSLTVGKNRHIQAEVKIMCLAASETEHIHDQVWASHTSHKLFFSLQKLNSPYLLINM